MISSSNTSPGYKVVSGGPGTVVLCDSSVVLERVIIPGTYVGTITFHDTAVAAGTSATTPILTLGLPTTSVATSLTVGLSTRRGLTYEATGTPVMTVVYG